MQTWQNIKAIVCGGCRNRHLQRAAVGVAALAWWGILYPELCFTEDTYEQIYLVEGEEVPAKQPELRGFLDAPQEEIVVKSRFLEWLEQKIGENR